MRYPTIHSLVLPTFLLGFFSLCYSQPMCEYIFEEKEGRVFVEAEHFYVKSKIGQDLDRAWRVRNANSGLTDLHTEGASGSQYLEILPDTRTTHDDALIPGINFTNSPGQEAEVSYRIYFHTPGKYFVWVRAYSSGSEDNGVHVGLNGKWPNSGRRMQWCEGKNAWTWASKQRTAEKHCGVEEQIFLEIPYPGLHTISFSMREDGFEMDKFALTQAYTQPEGMGEKENLLDCEKYFRPTLSGELKKWHKVTLSLKGPYAKEGAYPNPFTDYRMAVRFTHDQTGKTYLVPGYFAADGDAANTGATEGNTWKVHFAPDEDGSWSYEVHFHRGKDMAIQEDMSKGKALDHLDGRVGKMEIQKSDKKGRDFRSKGRLAYVGEHYLQFQGNKEWFVKAGSDAPENMLSYMDFDGTPGAKKDWSPHLQDYQAGEAEAYTWGEGKGRGLLGAIAYLSKKGVNACSFLTFSLDGDDGTVFPHLKRPEKPANKGKGNSWYSPVFRDRFDVSKLDQWERIFSYADQKGVFLHFKLQETENDQSMDGGDMGRERSLYFRELIARFGHHLALNWNLGEENTQTTAQQQEMTAYFHRNDPYQHLVVIHTYPNQREQVYRPLLGTDSELTGLSIQTSHRQFDELYSEVVKWVGESEKAGKKWVVSLDEPGTAQIGIHKDPIDNDLVRSKVLWATLLGGGMGVEYYYGYQTDCTDLNCEDHRTRDQKYTEAHYALRFFQEYFQPYLPNVQVHNSPGIPEDVYVLKSSDGAAYAVYMPHGGSIELGLPRGSWQVSWYNPRTGEMEAKQRGKRKLTAPDGKDWVALIEVVKIKG